MKNIKKNKFSFGMKIAGILCAVSLVSVGFASWWIVNYPAAQEDIAGNFTVYSVTSKKITINNIHFLTDANDTNEPIDDNGANERADASIIFGKPANAATYFTDGKTNHNWLGQTAVDDEDLETILQFSVGITEGAEDNDALASYVDSINVEFDAASIEDAIGNGLAAPKAYYRLGTTGDWSEAITYNAEADAPISISIAKTAFTSGATVTVQVKFEFGWKYQSAAGQTNGNKADVTINPYLHYNSYAYDAALAEELSKKVEGSANTGILETISALNTANYSVTISTTPSGSN